ncbi:MAG: hypothetical protein Q9181_002516, partial [Wetmoreana brouardii]
MPLFSNQSPNPKVPSVPDPEETEILTQNTDAMQRFTAIGRPYALPLPLSVSTQVPFPVRRTLSLLPKKRTDDKLIHLSMPTYNPSSLANYTSDFVASAPQHLPQKFTDDSILTIPIPFSDLVTPPSSPSITPSTDPITADPQSTGRRSSLFGMLKPKSADEGGKKKKKAKKGDFKM